MLKLSLIIPVYNEERHIKACLDAVACQTTKPFEVIVVDNNCSDGTLEIAKSYDFVSIVHENRQGLIHARNAGFTKAKGDILGRIDADSIIKPDWVEIVLKSFKSDVDLSGVTGLAKTDFIPFISRYKSTLFTRTYFWFVDASLDTVVMWGANMALRKNAWEVVRKEVTLDDKEVHEDQDLSLWMASYGMKIEKNKLLSITTDGQSYRYLPKLIYYYNLFRKTKQLHKANGNLNSTKLRRLGFWKTFPGRILGYFPTLLLVAVSVILFPVDFYRVKRYGNTLR